MCWVLLLCSAGVMAQGRLTLPAGLPKTMKQVQGKYHVLVHDLSDDQAREVLLRMQAITEEYAVRTRDFSGQLRGKLPFILFRRPADYYRAGGLEGSAGVFTGTYLMAIAGDELTPDTWHVIQHEAFHQFARSVINDDLPPWINEGLAEYFSEAVYTGDGFVSGAIPAQRLDRVKESIQSNAFRPLQDMMHLKHAEWNSQLTAANYDQAWAMAMFLAHGDNGKYQKTFSRFMVALNRGILWEKAWLDTFGSAEGFEKQMNAWWLGLPDTAGHETYARAAVQMLSGYLARATLQKQTFSDIDALLNAIENKQIKQRRDDLLAPGLAVDCVSVVQALRGSGAVFSLEAPPVNASGFKSKSGKSDAVEPAPTMVVCQLKSAARVTGLFKLQGNKVKSVTSTVYPVAEAVADRPADKPVVVKP
jgi:hypothetical protein